ncbi:TA system toxin CbtA family protein [Escherichia coli]|nr:TA system toxin CbtA family protein [Escherichia coli]
MQDKHYSLTLNDTQRIDDTVMKVHIENGIPLSRYSQLPSR